jgi:hypothetical protein
MRVGFLAAVAVATMSMPTRMPAQLQSERAAAALVLAEGADYLNDSYVESNAVPRVLPDR